MATKTTNKTLWTVALIAAFAFAAWKLLPILARKLNGGSSGGGSGVGGGGGVPYFPGQSEQPGSGSGSGLNFGTGNGNGPGGGFNNPYFGGPISAQNALDSFITGTQQIDESTTPGGYEYGQGTIGDYSTAAESSSSALGNDTVNPGGIFNWQAVNNWFLQTFSPGQEDQGIGPTTADASEYSQIQTVSDDLSDQSISQDQGSLDNYDQSGFGDDYNDPGYDDNSGGSNADGGGEYDGDNGNQGGY